MQDELATKIGSNIAESRRFLKLSQKQIAEELNWEQSTVSRIESGLRVSDKTLIYLQLLKIKGIDMNSIFNK